MSLSPPVRPARPSDAVRLARIESCSWRHAYAGMVPEGLLRRMEPAWLADRWRVRIHCASRCLWVIEDQGVVAGYASIGDADHPDLEPGFAGEVFELYVHPEQQRCGLGRALLSSALDTMRGLGRLWGVLEVLQDNHQARRFYEAFGMQTDKIVRRRPSGLWCSIGGRRYSHSHGSVRVVRYEIPLQPALRGRIPDLGG